MIPGTLEYLRALEHTVQLPQHVTERARQRLLIGHPDQLRRKFVEAIKTLPCSSSYPHKSDKRMQVYVFDGKSVVWLVGWRQPDDHLVAVTVIVRGAKEKFGRKT